MNSSRSAHECALTGASTSIDASPTSENTTREPTQRVVGTPVPLAKEEFERAGVTVVGFVQVQLQDDATLSIPVGVAPIVEGDREGVAHAGGYFVDRDGCCGILLNGRGDWRSALPHAIDDARRRLTELRS